MICCNVSKFVSIFLSQTVPKKDTVGCLIAVEILFQLKQFLNGNLKDNPVFLLSKCAVKHISLCTSYNSHLFPFNAKYYIHMSV